MTKISANIICKNEEEMLPAMFESIKGVDEIIFLDTGSTDKSIEIAKSYGAKIFEDPWIDDFSNSRNSCMKHATGEWHLIIDADEILDTPMERIRNMLNLGIIKQKAYDLILFDVQTGVERNEQPRLIRNKPDIWYFGAVHNLPRYFPEGLDHPEKSVNIPMDKAFKANCHITANVSPNHAKDPDRSKRILESALKQEPHNTRHLYYYVREWLNRKDPIKALYFLDRYFKLSGPTNECADAHFIAATCHWDLGDTYKAVNECMEAIKILATFRAPYQLLEMLAHPDMKETWNRHAKAANNKGVLFIRDMRVNQLKPQSNLKIVKK